MLKNTFMAFSSVRKHIGRTALFGCVLFLFLAISGSWAFAAGELTENSDIDSASETSRAPYLEAGLYTTVSSFTHSISWIDEIKLHINCKAEPENFHDFIYEVDPETSFGFLSETADRRELVYAGTFLSEPDVRKQFSFLTEVNQFPIFTPEQMRISGGTAFNLIDGDLLFWLDEEGKPVNAGLVCETHRTYYNVAVHNEAQGTALLFMDPETLALVPNYILIRPVYSSNEQQLFLFCIEKIRCSRAGACGILANISYESGFHTGVEELERKDGFGICQWSFERRDALNSFCSGSGRDIWRLESQMEFLKYELQNGFAFTGDFLKTAPNTTTGAYDSGYWFCFEYELPTDFEFASDDRACCSRDEYWPVYGS